MKMKQNKLFWMSLVLMLAFGMSSCSSDDEPTRGLDSVWSEIPDIEDMVQNRAWQIVREQVLHNQLDNVIVYVSNDTIQPWTIIGAYYDSYQSPDYASWLFFIDDIPNGNWSHPCRYVYVNVVDGKYEVRNCSWMPTTLEKDYTLIVKPSVPMTNDIIESEEEEALSNKIPEGALNQTATEFTGQEWFMANVHLYNQDYTLEGNLKVKRDALGNISEVWFGEAPAEERPKTVAEFINRFFGEGIADGLKCIQHIEFMTDVHEYYQQYYKGVFVRTDPFCIGFRDGLMLFGDSDYLPIKDFDVTPQFSKQVAIEIFKSFKKLDNYTENRCQLQIVRVPQGDSFGPRLAYEVRNGLEGLLIDAVTGRALCTTSYDWGM